MSWLLLAIVAYLLLAVANVSDKLFLKTLFRHPAMLASVIGGLGIFSFILVPFGEFGWNGAFSFWTSIVAGVLFVCALLFFFHALGREEASRVIPYIGALNPIITLLFSALVLEELLSGRELIAFIILIVGGYIVAHDPWSHPKEHSYTTWILASLSSVFFAISFVLSKMLFEDLGFINAFVWIRVGSFVGAFALIAYAFTKRKEYLHEFSHVASKGFFAFVGVQIVGGLGFVLQNVAISMGSVSLVNAMQGVQYVFVIAFAAAMARKFPKLIQEKVSKKIIMVKLVGVVIIGVGLVLLS